MQAGADIIGDQPAARLPPRRKARQTPGETDGRGDGPVGGQALAAHGSEGCCDEGVLAAEQMRTAGDIDHHAILPRLARIGRGPG